MESLVSQLSTLLNAGSKNKSKIEKKGRECSFVSACLQVIPEAHSALKGSSVLQQSLVHHWLTHFQLHLLHATSMQEFLSKLQYVNRELGNRDYLCGFSVSVADLVLFLLLQPFLVTWSYQQKERLGNLSRWYQCMDSTSNLLQNYKKRQPVNFSRSLLYMDDAINYY
ncbi:Glutathione S-transferase C-terminal-like [Trinorchestia longiramus]|nr:Glutathione S-transferase C-terminal-like [Trinorchestia longiramus]